MGVRDIDANPFTSLYLYDIRTRPRAIVLLAWDVMRNF